MWLNNRRSWCLLKWYELHHKMDCSNNLPFILKREIRVSALLLKELVKLYCGEANKIVFEHAFFVIDLDAELFLASELHGKCLFKKFSHN